MNSLATSLRPAWMEVDLQALTHNAGLVRQRVGDDVQIFAVVKSHGFGCGAPEAGRAALAGGANALAVGDPADVQSIRAAGIDAPVLLYASTSPQDAAATARLGAIVTIHDLPSLEAYAALDQPVEAFLKVEAGLGRLGVRPSDFQQVFDKALAPNSLSLTGIYTHLNAPDDSQWIQVQMAVYRQACQAAEQRGLQNLTYMVASSHVVLGYEELHLNAVNPGRFLFGLIEGSWAEIEKPRPVMRAIKSRIIQTKQFDAGDVVGFLGPDPIERDTRLAVLPIGFGDGFNHLGTLGEVLICEQRAPVVGRRGIEHTVVDISAIAAAQSGSEAVLLGTQGENYIEAAELAEWLGLPILELMPRLARNLPKQYIE